jgi:hypothetical protein
MNGREFGDGAITVIFFFFFSQDCRCASLRIEYTFSLAVSTTEL